MALDFRLHLPGFYPSFTQLPLVRSVETGYVSTTIYPTFYKHITVEFSIPGHWGECVFDIYRAETNIGPWVKITDTPITGNYFKDVHTRDFSKFMNGWYIVEVQLPDGRRVQGPPTTWHNKRSNWVELRAKEIERRETLLLEKFVGIKSLVFRRKHFGMRCPNCWNDAIEKVTQDHCPICLGTSFNGGYFSGFETLFQYDQVTQAPQLEYRGRLEPNTITAWTISFPEIEVFDLILRVPDWRMFRVDALQNTELQTATVRQIVTLTELAKESIEYKLASQAMPEGYA
jgi:hypothetical protein